MVQTYRLTINHVEHTCLFELTWGDGMQIPAQVPYPQELIQLYQGWQRAYYNFYRTLPKIDETVEPSALRGRTGAVGQVPVAQTDLRSQLAQAEVRLLTAFHRWLERGALIDIRGQLNMGDTQGPTTLYITCAAMELRRLPWEMWELTRGFGQGPPIRIVRLPAKIPVAANPPRKQRCRARALVIIGDDTGLDFRADLVAIERLKTLVDVSIVGWRQGMRPAELIVAIREQMRDPDGWDMLFFFGHSNEAVELGGEVAIAPQTTLSIHDLEADLSAAKRNGLQFALFNSCKGLDIAQRLVALGLNQVVIMREPIHNRVAQYFLLQFLQQIARYDDVHTALQTATKALKAEKTMAYPSAYLVPSLFSHRGAQVFRLQPVGWQARLAELWPSAKQGVVLGAIAILSILSPVRERLIAYRLWTQAVSYQLTRSVLPSVSPQVSPPVLLIHIDEKSIAKGIPDGEASPINRAYLAQLLDNVVALESQIIGIDYLLDRQQTQTNPQLANSIKNAVDQGSWLIFASQLSDGQEIGPQAELVNPNWAMQGYINAPPWYLKALQTGRHCYQRCPFSYLLAMTQATLNGPASKNVIPSSNRNTNLRQDLLSTIAQQTNDPLLTEIYQYRLSPILSLSRRLNQRWLQPILDFSIPLDHIYERIPAHELLERDITDLKEQYDWPNKVVLIGAGGYDESGIGNQRDYVENPPAIQFWRDQNQDLNSRFTGVEAHAYNTHHLLNRHWVTPIPNLWMVGIGTLLGASSAVALQQEKRFRNYRWQGLFVFSVGYGLMGLSVYSTLSIVLPWLLPTAAVWVYHIPSLRHSNKMF